MIKKIISAVLAVAMIFSMCAINFSAFAESKPKAVKLTMFSNLCEDNEIDGIYKDGIFYIKLEKACELIGAKIAKTDKKEVVVETRKDVREFTLSLKDNKMKDSCCKKEIKMPSFVADSEVYVSALHFLRYSGADVSLKENDKPQFMVSLQYNILDFLADHYEENYGHLFWWDEVETTEGTLEDKLVNAGVVALINRNSNIIKMTFDPEGIAQEAIEENLAEIVTNEGQNSIDKNDEEIIEKLSWMRDVIDLTSSGIDFVSQSALPPELLNFTKFSTDFAGASSDFADVGSNFFNSIVRAQLFYGFTDGQKNLLKNTILQYPERSATLNNWQIIYDAAKVVNKRVDTALGNELSIFEEIYKNTSNDFLSISSPITFAWDAINFVNKTIPYTKNIIEKKTKLYYAYNCSIIQIVANDLILSANTVLGEDFSCEHPKYQKSSLEDLKYSYILKLKSTLTTRQNLIDSGFLDSEYASEMKDIIKDIVILLYKAEICKIIPIGVEPEVKEDLSWMNSFEEADVDIKDNLDKVVTDAADSDSGEIEDVTKDTDNDVTKNNDDNGDVNNPDKTPNDSSDEIEADVMNWDFDKSTGTLLITGSKDYIQKDKKWFDFKDRVKKIVIKGNFDSILDSTFSDFSNLESVNLPEGLKSIGDFAFHKDSSLKTINLPKSLTSIGRYSFEKCDSLTSVNIPDKVKEMGEGCFSDCSAINNIHIGKGLTVTPKAGFAGCTSLKSVNIPDTVKEIAFATFARCTSLEKVVIGDGVVTIGNEAFSENTSLKQIVFGANVRTIGGKCFQYCSSLETIRLPDKLTAINFWTFLNCTSLTTVYMPKSVVKIDDAPFNGCESLRNIYYAGTQSQWNSIENADRMLEWYPKVHVNFS